MSYIIREGNLAEAPELRQGENGPYTYATVIVNDRERVDGKYVDTGSIAYSLTVSGMKAQRLVEAAQAGNIRIVFGGRYRVREYDRKDGQGKGVSHDVRVDVLGASLTGQSVHVERKSGGEDADAPF